MSPSTFSSLQVDRPPPSSQVGSATGSIGTAPDTELIDAFADAGGAGKPRYGQLTVCWAPRARRRAAHGAQVVANRGTRGSARPGASAPVTLRGRRRDGDRGRGRPDGRVRPRSRGTCRPRSDVTRTPATTTSTSTKSGPTRRASSTSMRRRSCRTTDVSGRPVSEQDEHARRRPSGNDPMRTRPASPGSGCSSR